MECYLWKGSLDPGRMCVDLCWMTPVDLFRENQAIRRLLETELMLCLSDCRAACPKNVHGHIYTIEFSPSPFFPLRLKRLGPLDPYFSLSPQRSGIYCLSRCATRDCGLPRLGCDKGEIEAVRLHNQACALMRVHCNVIFTILPHRLHDNISFTCDIRRFTEVWHCLILVGMK